MMPCIRNLYLSMSLSLSLFQSLSLSHSTSGALETRAFGAAPVLMVPLPPPQVSECGSMQTTTDVVLDHYRFQIHPTQDQHTSPSPIPDAQEANRYWLHAPVLPLRLSRVLFKRPFPKSAPSLHSLLQPGPEPACILDTFQQIRTSSIFA